MLRTFTKKFSFAFAAMLASTGVFAQNTPVADTVILGASYTNQSFYDLSSGDKNYAPKAEWTLGFQANSIMTAGVWFNQAVSSGAAVYVIPSVDATDFGTSIDTTGFVSWQRLQNGTDVWDSGAFNTGSNGLDYGWGTYNTTTHEVSGTKLYLLQFATGEFKVLLLESLTDGAMKYKFRYSDIDGSNAVQDSVSKDLDKNLVYYNILTSTGLDREPAKDAWDLLFTSSLYAEQLAPNYWSVPGGFIYLNAGVEAVMVSDVADVATFEDTTGATFTDSIGVIGISYREFANPVYTPTDSTVYFVKDAASSLYKLVFTSFEGQGTGLISFEKTEVLPSVGINNVDNASRFVLYPNPAVDQLNIVIDAQEAGVHQVTVTDLTGKVAYSSEAFVSGLQNINIPVSSLANGYYLVSVEANGSRSVKKFVKQ